MLANTQEDHPEAPNDGGPAFAQPCGMNGYPARDVTGVSVRDYFAAHCPITFTEFLTGWKKTGESDTDAALLRFASFRFEYADAMLKAREAV